MKFENPITFYILFGVGVGLLNWFIAGWKSRDRYCWFLLGLLTNIVSLFVLFFLPSLQNEIISYNTDVESGIERHRKITRIKQRCLYGIYFLITIFLLYILFILLHRFIV